MTTLANIQRRIQEADDLLARYEQAIVETPNLPSLGANIRSLQRIRAALEQDFNDEANSLGIEVCRYRMFGDNGEPGLPEAAATLASFQSLFSTVYDAIKNGPKQNVRPTTVQTKFGIGYSFRGSLGVALTVPRSTLFPDHFEELEQTARVVFDLAKLNSVETIRDASKKYGLASIRAVYKWAETQATYSLGAEVSWCRNQNTALSFLIQKPEIERLRRLIGQSGDEKIETLNVVGSLRGASLESKSFEIRTVSNQLIVGKFRDGVIGEQNIASIPTQYAATIEVTTEVHYSTDLRDTTYLLVELRKHG